MNEKQLFENSLHVKNEDQDSVIQIRDLMDKYTYHWKWFLFSLFLALGLAFTYLRFANAIYEVSAAILINEDQSTGLNTELSAFQDIGLITGPKTSIINEIGVLKSKSLMRKVIKEMDLNITYFHKKNFKNIELYKNSTPFKMNFVDTDSANILLDTSLIVAPESKKSYVLKSLNKEIIGTYNFGENVSLGFGIINILPNELFKGNFEDEFRVQISPVDEVADAYIKSLEIEPETKKSSILLIKLKDPVKQRAIDIINTLVLQYNQNAIDYKALLTQNTDKFVNERIIDISQDLGEIDEKIEAYKIRNQLTDINKEAGLDLEYDSRLEKEVFDLNSKLKMIDYLTNYLNNNKNDLIPVNLGINDQASLSNIEMYNKLLLERNRIIKGTGKLNPVVINLDEQIEGLRKNILQSLDNVKSSYTFALNEAQTQAGMIDAKRYVAPKQEREFQDIKRSQQIVESLYLYLLQKREENAISLGVPIPTAQIIDQASGSREPVAPKKILIYALALFLGFLFPVVLISAKSLIDTKIHTADELTKLINAPALGDIPITKNKKEIVIDENQNHSIAEAFRLIRTNLGFMISKKAEIAETILITSTIGGEGKTFISLNLSSVLSSTNNRVLLIEADLRKPKLKKYANLSSKKGLTHYLADASIEPEEIIEKLDTTNIDTICAGEIPPNPTNLLMGSRMTELINYAKKHYDYILIDTPPSKLVTDTLILSSYGDLIVYVVRANYLDKRLLKSMRPLLQNYHLKNVALILNGVNEKKSGYGYSYGYK